MNATRHGYSALVVLVALLAATQASAQAGGGLWAGAPSAVGTLCVGDGDGIVTVAELVLLVNVALGTSDVGVCAMGDTNDDGQSTVDEIIAAVNRALGGCSALATS